MELWGKEDWLNSTLKELSLTQWTNRLFVLNSIARYNCFIWYISIGIFFNEMCRKYDINVK